MLLYAISHTKGLFYMHIALNAGHTLTKAGGGACGYLTESIETRKITNAVKRYLAGKGHKVTVVNIDTANTQASYLYLVAKKVNKTNADLFVSIHLNAGGGQGCETFTWKGIKTPQAVGICEELSKLGFKNRGVKDGSHLYVVSKTTMPAILTEVCFVDSKTDSTLYKSLGVNKIAQAITRGILRA